MVRNGRCAGTGRQRYRCFPADGGPHTFTTAGANSGFVRSYRHTAADIALALTAVGRGCTYRQAAIRLAEPSRGNGQLVSDWVRTFTPVVAARRTSWPRVLLATSVRLRAASGGISVLAGVGAESLNAPMEVCHLQAVPADDAAGWATFFTSLAGVPDVLAADPCGRAAAVGVWRSGGPKVVALPSHAGRPDVVAHGSRMPARRPPSSWAPALEDVERCRGALVDRLGTRWGRFRDSDQLANVLALIRADLNGNADEAWYTHTILEIRSDAAVLPLKGARNRFAAPDCVDAATTMLMQGRKCHEVADEAIIDVVAPSASPYPNFRQPISAPVVE